MPEERRVPVTKLEKETVNYRSLEKCGLCVNFYSPNNCSEVEGNIAPDAVCDKFNLRENSKPWTKEFYAEEYRKDE